MIGALKHLIDLSAPARTDDEAGGGALSYAVAASAWGAVERLTATRDYAGARANRLRRVAVTVRRRSDVALGWRLAFDGADYEIVSIEDGDDARLVTLIGEEVAS